MSNVERGRLEELEQQYPTDHCRQIAAYVLEAPDVPDSDRVCAAGILSALDAADHAGDLLVVAVNKSSLLAAAHAEAGRLWERYGSEQRERGSGRRPIAEEDA